MMKRTEFAGLLELIVDELSALVLRDAERATKTSLLLRTEIDESVRLIRETAVTRAQVLGVSFGLVDEFVRAHWEAVVDELLEAYIERVRIERPSTAAQDEP